MKFWAAFSALFFSVVTAGISQGDVIITETNPTGSSTTTYAADWFELTNTGSTDVNITGWRMDDNSNSFGASVALTGVTTIGAGQSVVFIDGTAAQATNFINDWFGGNAPAGFQIGLYSGSGVGLSSAGDAVNVFDSAGTLMAKVTFPSATLGFTFDNSAGINNGQVSTLSSLGVNGAIQSGGGEIGSPGAIPEPSAAAIFGLATIATMLQRRKRS